MRYIIKNQIQTQLNFVFICMVPLKEIYLDCLSRNLSFGAPSVFPFILLVLLATLKALIVRRQAISFS